MSCLLAVYLKCWLPDFSKHLLPNNLYAHKCRSFSKRCLHNNMCKFKLSTSTTACVVHINRFKWDDIQSCMQLFLMLDFLRVIVHEVCHDFYYIVLEFYFGCISGTVSAINFKPYFWQTIFSSTDACSGKTSAALWQLLQTL